MKTSLITGNTMDSRHAFMAVLGIVVAIICSLVLLQELNSPKDEFSHMNVSSKTNVAFNVQAFKSITLSIMERIK